MIIDIVKNIIGKFSQKGGQDDSPPDIDVEEGELFSDENVLDVEYFSQRDNTFYASTSCYPTSVGMMMMYCLKLKGLDRTAVGCAADRQIEDFITEITESKEMKEWIKQNVGRYGNWMFKYSPRTIAYCETWIFNKLMNQHGYNSVFETNLDYNMICKILNDNQLPIVLRGDFSSVSKTVKGHMVCCVGYNKTEESLILHDPYGNANTGYKDVNGEYVSYSMKFFKTGNGKVWGQIATKI